MLADKSGNWYYFMRKTFIRFLLACWNLGNFKNRLEGGRCERLCIFVYMQHEVRPFVRRGVLGAILYTMAPTLGDTGFPRTYNKQDKASDRTPTPFLVDIAL